MTEAIRAGALRICPSCGSRNKASHNFCVRCSAPMDAAEAGAPRMANAPASGNPRLMRFLLAGGLIAAVGAGLFVRSMLAEVPDVSEDVRADSARTVDAPPPPEVSGWAPGAGLPEPQAAPWSSESFPVARPNPYDVPGDPATSMVGIAPSAPRVRAAVNRRRVYTEADLLATRGGAWSAPAPTPEPARPAAVEPASEEVVKRESKLRDERSRLEAAQARLSAMQARAGGVGDDDERRSLDDAREDVEDAQKDAARAARKLEEARRNN
jgi:hypothetical protein